MSEEDGTGSSARERTPYLRYLKQCLLSAEQENHSLFQEEEEEREGVLGVCGLVKNLPELSQCLLARLLMRSGEWHRTDRLLSCMPRDLLSNSKQIDSTSPAEAALREALGGLKEAKVLEELSMNHSFDDSWSAMNDCLFSDEIRSICLNITKSRSKGDKSDVLNKIHQTAKSTRDLFDRPISLSRQINQVLNGIKLVRLSSSVLTSIRRMQRLLQMSSSGGELSSGRSCFSTSKPLPMNFALLSIIGKIRYPRYTIVNTSPAFPSSRLFRYWEAANELRVCFDEASSLMRKQNELSSFLLKSVCFGNNNKVESSLRHCGLQCASLTPLQRTCIESLRSRILSSVAVFEPTADADTMTRSHQTVKNLFSTSADLDGFAAGAFYLSTLSLIGISACVCFRSYLRSHAETSTSKSHPFLNQLDAGIILSTLCYDSTEQLEKDVRANKSAAVSVDEENNASDQLLASYALPIQILRFLIHGTYDIPISDESNEACSSNSVQRTYASRRLGKLIERLCIDLEHEGLMNLALLESKNALSDPDIQSSCLVGLKKRHLRLSQSKKKQSKSVLIPSLQDIILGMGCLGGDSMKNTDKSLSVADANSASAWECSSCTLLNSILNYNCSLCESRRTTVVTSSSFNSFKGSASGSGVCIEILDDGSDSCDDNPTTALSAVAKSSDVIDIQNSHSNKSFEFLSDSKTRAIMFNNHADDFTCCFDRMVPTLIVTGRRLGNLRAGKNKLIGVSGDAVSVEELVMQTMENSFDEGVVSMPATSSETEKTEVSPLEPFCGGWVGWHCEGSVLRGIFCLMMWSEIFITVDDVQTPSTIGPSVDFPPLEAVRDSFRTPYQDSPLDLHAAGGLFYLNRKGAIDAKLEWIKLASSQDIVEYLGQVYRRNFKSRCTGMSWSHPLKTLQMVAVCLHSHDGVYGLCRMMSVDYRQFSSGAPDLLMIRGVKNTSSGDVSYTSREDWNRYLGEGWERLSGSGQDASDGLFDKEESLVDDDDDGSKPAKRRFAYVGGKRRSLPVTSNTKAKKQKQKQPQSTSTGLFSVFNAPRRKASLVEDDTSEAMSDRSKEVVVIDSDDDDKDDEDSGEDKLDGSDEKEQSENGGHITSSDSAVHGSFDMDAWLQQKFHCDQEDLKFPDDTSFECMLVEVKGPTDRLSDKQRIWCQALSAYDIPVRVCRVDEGEGGYHTTAES